MNAIIRKDEIIIINNAMRDGGRFKKDLIKIINKDLNIIN